MAENNNYDSAFVLKQVITSSSAPIDLMCQRNQINLIADTDCFVNFDKAVTATGRFLLKANIPMAITDANISTMSVLGTSGNLYIAAFIE